MEISYQHLTSSDDLVTTYEAIRAGFVSLALEKNRRATPFVVQARALKVAACSVKTPIELLKIKEIQPALLAAAGVSDKATKHLEESDKIEAIQGLISNFLEPAGEQYAEELVYRFLLTRGDTLGGSMRNVNGALAQRKFTRAVISTLVLSGTSYEWLHSINNSWTQMTANDADIELHLRALSWKKNGEKRTLYYNLKVPLVKNNVDLCLFNCPSTEFSKNTISSTINEPSMYIALGELKGGIDPAGADEHWKTAGTALNRIVKAFSTVGLKPHTLFIAGAIEKKMASEIWSQLQEGTLENAANLTNDNQVASISQWLCNL